MHYVVVRRQSSSKHKSYLRYNYGLRRSNRDFNFFRLASSRMFACSADMALTFQDFKYSWLALRCDYVLLCFNHIEINWILFKGMLQEPESPPGLFSTQNLIIEF